MRYRALDANGDYTFGRGQGNFLINSPACVAQAVQTALLLKQGEWFLDTTVGVPYDTKVLGYGTSSTYDLTIREAILNVEGVTAITSYSSSRDPKTRRLTINATISTKYGATTISTVIFTGYTVLAGDGSTVFSSDDQQVFSYA